MAFTTGTNVARARSAQACEILKVEGELRGPHPEIAGKLREAAAELFEAAAFAVRNAVSPKSDGVLDVDDDEDDD